MIYQIQHEDIGKRTVSIAGEHIHLNTTLQRSDVGKRVHYRHYGAPRVRIETDEEFAARDKSGKTHIATRKIAFTI